MNKSKQHLEQYINKYVPKTTTQKALAEILGRFSFLQLSKNDYLVSEGAICNYFCFINHGILQHSIIVDGEEKTTYLGLKNSATTALNSFKNKTPSRKNIKAITDSDLWILTFEDFNSLLKNDLTFKTFYFNLIENQIFLIDDYRIDLLTLSPEERYQKLLNNDPILLQKVPLRYLASFLGVSERHLSRIRKNSK